MDLELAREDFSRVVDNAVRDLLDRAGVQGPPIDALALARFLSVALEPDTDLEEEQRQAQAARAIGNHLKPGLLEQLGFDRHGRRPSLGLSLTGLVAERLLVPSPWFEEDAAGSGPDLLALQRRYCTASPEILAFRLLDLPTPCVITLMDSDSILRRKSNGVRIRKKLESPEADCALRVLESGEPHQLRRAGWTVQGWPVRIAGRARAILRSVPDEDHYP